MFLVSSILYFAVSLDFRITLKIGLGVVIVLLLPCWAARAHAQRRIETMADTLAKTWGFPFDDLIAEENEFDEVGASTSGFRCIFRRHPPPHLRRNCDTTT